MTDRRIVIGMDGGGTTTRTVVMDLTGRALAWAQAGSASTAKSPHARENVRQAIRDVVTQAGRGMTDVAAFVAGLANLDGPEDEVWAAETTRPGLACPRLHVNDTVVAHAGALESRPGIIAIAGTGANIYGVTEAGRVVRCYDFHYAPAAQARSLSYAVVHRLLAGDAGPGDGEMVRAVLEFWGVADLVGLREAGALGFVADHFGRNRRFGEMAPLVTAAASLGSPLACHECDRAAETLGVGIRLLGGCFADDFVSVALIGGVVRSPYFQAAMARTLGQSAGKRYEIAEPAAPGEIGAARMAMQMISPSTPA